MKRTGFMALIIGMLIMCLGTPAFAEEAKGDVVEPEAAELVVACDNAGREIPLEEVDEDSYDGFIYVLREDAAPAQVRTMEKKISRMDEKDAGEVVPNETYRADSLETIDEVADLNTVAFIEPDYLMHADTDFPSTEDLSVSNQAKKPNDPRYSDNEWIYKMLKVEPLWDRGICGAGQKGNDTPWIAFIDSGLVGLSDSKKRHEDMSYSGIVEMHDKVYSSSDEIRGYIKSGHGTFAAGIVRAIMNNGKGTTGLMPDVNIIPYKVNNGDTFPTSRAIKAVDTLVEKGRAAVINMSHSSSFYSSEFANVCRKAADAGIIVVAAAGNSSFREKKYPASYPGIISVGSINRDAVKSGFSTYNDAIDVVAPGEDVLGLDYYATDSYKRKDGTSWAAPMVSAMAAMVKSIDPAIDHDAFMKILQKTSTDLGTAGKDEKYGYGCANFWGAYQYVTNGGEIPTGKLENICFSQNDYNYEGHSICPDVTIVASNGAELIEGIDYKLEYYNNDRMGTAYVKATGIGNYTGTITGEFHIYGKLGNIDLSQYDYNYKGHSICPDVTVVASNGAELIEGIDYELEYYDNDRVGEARVEVTGIGNYKGTITSEFHIHGKLEDIWLSQDEYYYKGHPICPHVTVISSYGVKLIEGIDYELEYYDNDHVGTAYAEATGIGNYSGAISGEFYIHKYVERGKITSVKAGKKKATIRIGKSTGAQKYQIAYKKKGGKYKIVSTWNRIKTIRKLKSNKVYYFKVRGISYENLDGYREPVYGKWSAEKKKRIR